MSAERLALSVPDDFVQAVAERVVLLLDAEQEQVPEPSWIGVQDAAEHLACPVSRIYRLVSMRRIPFEKDGVEFPRSGGQGWVRRRWPFVQSS